MMVLKSVNFEQQQFQHHKLEQTYAGQTEWIIGRSSTCDLILPNPEVSRIHGRIVCIEGVYYFTDIGSTSGSLLNGKNISPDEQHQLHSGDLLQLGETFLYVEELMSFSEVGAVAPDSFLLPEKPWSNEELWCCCQRIVDETPDVKTFFFVAEPPMLFSYLPGQFVNLELEIEGKPVIRSYSISSSPTRPYHLSITVKRVPNPSDRPDIPTGLVSNWLHDNLKVGDRIKLIGGPLGHFTCLPALPSKLLLISAGSGITPMMSMTRWIQDTLTDSDVIFLHSARTSEDIVFRAELEAIAAQMPNFHLAVTVTQQPMGRSWMGLNGRISESMLQLVASDLLERAVYVCGPNAFMQDIRSLLETMQFPMQNYKEESFGGRPQSVLSEGETQVPKYECEYANGSTNNGKGHNESDRTSISSTFNDSTPTIHFISSDRKLTADDNASILEIAEQENIPIRNACRIGACGACKVRIPKGQVRYDSSPAALTEFDRQAGYALACVAYPIAHLEVEA